MAVISYLQSGGERVPWEGGDGWRVVMMSYLEGEANRYPWKCKDRRDCQEPQHHHCCFGRPPRGLFSAAPLLMKAWALLCCAVNSIEAAAAVMLCRPSRRCLFSVVPSNLKAWALLCCAVIDNKAAALLPCRVATPAGACSPPPPATTASCALLTRTSLRSTGCSSWAPAARTSTTSPSTRASATGALHTEGCAQHRWCVCIGVAWMGSVG